jgi:hypothetical protein
MLVNKKSAKGKCFIPLSPDFLFWGGLPRCGILMDSVAAYILWECVGVVIGSVQGDFDLDEKNKKRIIMMAVKKINP